jgi:hypothetical protein
VAAGRVTHLLEVGAGEAEHGEELAASATMAQTSVMECLALISSETTASLFGCDRG